MIDLCQQKHHTRKNVLSAIQNLPHNKITHERNTEEDAIKLKRKKGGT